MQHVKRGLRALALAAFIGGLSAPAEALTIDPGFDLFMTDPVTTFADLGSLGVIPLKGVPLVELDPVPFAGLGMTDTIVKRSAQATLLGIGDFEMIPIELVALSLHSVAPINIGGTFFDLRVLAGSLLGPSQPLGSMTIMLTVPNGGTFDAQLPVNALLAFHEVGNPGNQVLNSFFDIFVSLDVPWTSTPPSDDKHNANFPSGGFFPGIDPLTGQPVLITEQGQRAQHGVFPVPVPVPVPAPGALALFGLGIVALAAVRRRVSSAVR